MNILVISHEYPPIGGGGANACYYLVENFVKAGHFVTIVTSSYAELQRIERRHNCITYRVPAIRRKRDKSNFLEMFTFLVSAWFRTRKLVKGEKFDICQVFFGIPSGPIALYLKKRYKIPYIVRLGGGDIPGAQKRFAFLYRVLTPFIRNVWKNAKCVVANSEGLKLRAEEFDRNYPIMTITNGVDVDFFSRSEEKDTNEKDGLTLLCVSRLLEGKGLQDIIPYMKKIEEEVGCTVVLQIVGDGPYKGELNEVVRRYKVEQNVKFEGRKEKEDLLAYYQKADIFILPSRSEGMPNVVLEAMSMGLPIIMTPCEGSKELVTNNGIVSSIDEMVNNVILLGKDKRLRKDMARNSAKIAREQFLWEKISLQYLSLFTK